MTSQTKLSQKNLFTRNALKPIALLSIAIYLVLVIVFESQSSSLSSLASVGLYICLGGCGLYIIAQKKIRVNWLIIALVLFGLFLFISTSYTMADSKTISSYLYRYWTSIILAFFIFNVPDEPRDLDFILSVIILAGTVLAIYMYVYYGWDYLISAEERLDGDFGNQNYTSMRCTFAIILAVFKIVTKKGVLRFLWLIPAALCVPAVMFLASRKAILIIAVSLFILFFLYSKNKSLLKKIVLVAVLFALIWFLINSIPAFSVIKDRFDEMFAFFEGNKTDSNDGDLNRQIFIEKSLQAFLDSPLIGKGAFYSSYLLGVHAHNNYVELLMNNGILGVGMFYFMHVKLLFDANRVKKFAPKQHGLVFMMVAALLTMDIGVTSYFDRVILLYLALCSLAVSPKLCALTQNTTGDTSSNP